VARLSPYLSNIADKSPRQQRLNLLAVVTVERAFVATKVKIRIADPHNFGFLRAQIVVSFINRLIKLNGLRHKLPAFLM
jgi:hypothetical protein